MMSLLFGGEIMDFILSNIPIIIGCSIALIIISTNGGNTMETSMWGIVIALISVIGVLIGHWFQFRKDGNRISEIKSDTAEIKPNVNDIKSKGIETYKFLSENINTQIIASTGKIDKIIENNTASSSSLNELVEELHFQQRIRSETSGHISKDYIIESVNEIYSDLAALQQENNILKNENTSLKAKNMLLQKENSALTKQLDIMNNDNLNKQEPQDIER